MTSSLYRKCDGHPRPWFTFEASTDTHIRQVWFQPGFHCGLDGPASHGVSGMTLEFVSKSIASGRAGSFIILTDWVLPETIQWWKEDSGRWFSANRLRVDCGGQVRIHSPTPWRADQQPGSMECEITGGECYSDVVFLFGSELWEVFVRDGMEAMFSKLDAWIEECVAA